MQYVTFAGDFMRQKSVDILRPIEAVLIQIGGDVVPVMQGIIREQVSEGARGELERSVAWRTANDHSQIEHIEDLIEAPPPHCVDIGSANSHAFYVDEGSGPHMNPEGSDEFVAEITEWVKRQGGNDSDAFMAIKSIRERGTDAKPFVKPTHEKMVPIAKRRCRNALAKYWRSMRQV